MLTAENIKKSFVFLEADMKLKALALVVVAGSLLFLQGCSRKLEGDVFVLGDNGTARKLPLVDIYAVPLSALSDFEKVANTKRDKEKAEVMATFASLDLKSLNEEHIAIKNVEADLLLRDLDRAAKGFSQFAADPVGDALKDKLRKRDEDLNQKIIAKFKAADVDGLYKKIKGIAPINFYSQEIKSYLTDASIFKVTTDAEGKFAMTLKGDDLVLVAIALGKDGTPGNFWLVKLPAADEKVTLSDANSFEKGCPSCLLAGTDKSLDSGEALSLTAYVISAYPKKSSFELSKERSWIFDYGKRAGLI